MISSIDSAKCTGCGTCFKSCPLDVFRLCTEQPELSPCMNACPAGTDLRGCHYLLQSGRTEEALELLKRTMPIPAITGRVCFHPCESACSRKDIDGAVNINGLEQFLGDLDLDTPTEPFVQRHVSRIAIVGSGPAGLSAAWYLAEMGYPVTVFDNMPLPGGMLRYGIPAYRLPDEVMDRQIQKFRDAGITFVCNHKVGTDDEGIRALKAQGFRAVILAIGASEGRHVGLEGENHPSVLTGLDFLRDIRSGKAPTFDKSNRVLVVGGGDVAMDAAISAKLLGAGEVTMISLETEGTLPAKPHNVADARNMGIELHCAWGPSALNIADGVLKGLLCRPCLSVVDSCGHFAPTFDERPEAEKLFEADTIILAIGQRIDLAAFAQDVATKCGRITVNADTMESSAEGIFAAGDAVSGPRSVTEAVAGGHKAAISVDRFLSGAELYRPEASKAVVDDMLSRLDPEKVVRLKRNERRTGSAEGFKEKTAGLPLDLALAEARRCLTCGGKARIAYSDDCMTCYTCEVRCPAGAVNVHPFKERLPRTLDSVRPAAEELV